MPAPTLSRLQQPPAPLSADAAADAQHAFLVVEEGDFAGISFAVGDVVLCRGEAHSGDPVVLVARFGRPRLGALQGSQLLGDAGERCHPGRWTAAGRVVAVMRQGRGGFVAELVEAGCARVSGGPGGVVPRRSSRPAAARHWQPVAPGRRPAARGAWSRSSVDEVVAEGQLSLFAA